jgi:FkbM family methyltransferase
MCHRFELLDDNLSMLRIKLEANDLENVKVNQRALWSIDNLKISLAGEDSHASRVVVGKNKDANSFSSQSIDGYARENDLKKIDVVMLDIEGGEYEALLGSKSVLSWEGANAPAVICEIHGAYVDWSVGLAATPLCKLLINHGYEVFGIRDYQGNDSSAGDIVELADIHSAVISGPEHGFNLLAVKSRRELSPNIFRIVSSVSPKLLHHRDPKIHAPLERPTMSLAVCEHTLQLAWARLHLLACGLFGAKFCNIA